jgi:multidrug efflux pump subunit AcrB
VSLARFGVHKPVPVNLLMIAVLLAGAASAFTLRREFFPETTPDQALITLPYPGAAPEEVEEALAIKVEDTLADIEEIKEIRSIISEGGGGITVEFYEGADVEKAVDDVERAVDALTDLPEESDRIQVRLFEPRLPVIRVSLFGDVQELVMKQAIRAVRDDLRMLAGMGEILISGVRDYEIRVDVRQQALLEQGISLPQIADAITAWMKEVPGGTVRSKSGNIKVRTMGVAERAAAVREIIVKADPQGRSVRLGDIAEVSDSLVDEQVINRFNGQAAANLTVFGVGDQDIVTMAEMVRAYVAGRNGEPFERKLLEWLIRSARMNAYELGRNSARPLPVGAKLAANSDLARFVEGRLDLLIRNARIGAVLVFATLLLFLNWRVAAWVGMGLLTAIMGTLVLMAWLDITLNLLTMFGLIVVLGLLVDDAIVVAENIQTRHDAGEPSFTAAIAGTEQVLWPVVATVVTTVVAFLPLTFIRGRIGELLGALPVVVTCALLMSLIEALLILPSHMAHTLVKRDLSHPGKTVSFIRRLEKWRDHIVLDRIIPAYGRLLAVALQYRYIAVAVAIGLLIVSIGLVRGGQVVFTFLPKSDSETIIVDARMPVGTPIERTNQIVSRIEQAAQAQAETLSVSSIIGQSENLDSGQTEAFAPHVAQMFIELKPVEQRERESSQVIAAIREALAGRLSEVDRITFSEIAGGPGGADISIRVRGEDMTQIDAAVRRIKGMLAEFDGVHDIADDSDAGQLEMRINLRPGAAALGFSTADVARQVRGFLYGLDAHVFAAQQEDIDVRVRLDEGTRRSLLAIEDSWLISPAGQPVPLSEIAEIEESSTYATVKRINRQRAVTVTAATAPGVSPEAIVSRLTTETTSAPRVAQERFPLDELRRQYPGLQIELSGRQEQLADALRSLPWGFLAAMLMIYVTLAWLFSSYIQPVVVMLAIPFSVIGVVWGHLLFGYEMTFLSLIGFVALSGIVVNDSLILVQFYNAERKTGLDVVNSLLNAGRARLRAIFLTTITTVFGLLPLMLEQSFQAKFLIPMAISITMGLVASTVVVLVVLPCLMRVFTDVKELMYFLWFGRPQPERAEAPAAADETSAPSAHG